MKDAVRIGGGPDTAAAQRPDAAPGSHAASGTNTAARTKAAAGMRTAPPLAFWCGFFSLSLEILWVRVYGFSRESTPAAFGFVLAAYLVGIALGARLGARACRSAPDEAALWRASVRALLLSGLASVMLPLVFVLSADKGIVHPLLAAALIALTSSVLAYVFPIAHHLGTVDAATGVGRRFARVYTANVLGAAIGPLVTGYVLLDLVSLQSAFVVLAVGQLLAGILLGLCRGVPGAWPAGGVVACMLAIAFAGLHIDPHWAVSRLSTGNGAVIAVSENRHGIVMIHRGARGDDAVLGGNVYDGRTNLDLVRNTNGLERPMLTAVLHPQPKRVLVLGMSIGTWLTLVRAFPGVERIDVVEIDPGYVDLARGYPLQAASMQDPRVHLFIDDGRRWLRNHPDRRYDIVIMNTTFHWRANASLLLSREMMELLRAHMAPGAVMAFNATGSPDAFHTAAQVFPHAYRFGNFIYGSDADFRARKDAPAARALYASMRLDGRPLFPPGSDAIAKFLAPGFQTVSEQQAQVRRPLETITDDNLLTEFRHGRQLYQWLDFVSFD